MRRWLRSRGFPRLPCSCCSFPTIAPLPGPCRATASLRIRNNAHDRIEGLERFVGHEPLRRLRCGRRPRRLHGRPFTSAYLGCTGRPRDCLRHSPATDGRRLLRPWGTRDRTLHARRSHSRTAAEAGRAQVAWTGRWPAHSVHRRCPWLCEKAVRSLVKQKRTIHLSTTPVCRGEAPHDDTMRPDCTVDRLLTSPSALGTRA